MIKIMVVDDEQDIQALFRQKFKKEIKENLIEFYFAFSGEDALKYLSTAKAADLVLILSDINMPGMNGLELLRILKEEYAHLKVFMITAYDDSYKYQKAQEYGANDYLTKPIDFEKLKNAINSLIK
ncbi:MAG TPA: response regulator [Melioribacteraceae bacterium]|nr:response regulator [Melioribacteraceae bacterium]